MIDIRFLTRVPFQSTIWTELERAREGDAAAYAQFVGRYRPAIVSYVQLLRTSGSYASVRLP